MAWQTAILAAQMTKSSFLILLFLGGKVGKQVDDEPLHASSSASQSLVIASENR